MSVNMLSTDKFITIFDIMIESTLQSFNVPKFLHCLVKLLKEESSDVIDWSKGKYFCLFFSISIALLNSITFLTMFDTGRIYVHNSKKLATILPRYFGHSKYPSFLRQLANYEFCRPPCKKRGIYMHHKTTEDVHSILQLKVCFLLFIS